MAIFDKKEEQKDSPTGEKSSKKETKKLGTKNSKTAYEVLVEPWITEKSHSMMSANKYVFKVARTATKTQVKSAIEGLYGVKVVKMGVVNISDKAKYFGRHVGKVSGFKKAIVTLKAGDSIELFGGAQ